MVREKGQELEPVYGWLGAVMTELREARNLTQTEVARRMGVDPSTITHYELCNNRMRMHVFVNWCKAVEVDPVVAFRRMTERMDEESA